MILAIPAQIGLNSGAMLGTIVGVVSPLMIGAGLVGALIAAFASILVARIAARPASEANAVDALQTLVENLQEQAEKAKLEAVSATIKLRAYEAENSKLRLQLERLLDRLAEN